MYPRLKNKRPDEDDINWINLEADHFGSFGIQFIRSDFANWTTSALKSFFSHFGQVKNIHIDKYNKNMYIRFNRKIDAYNAMTCMKGICHSNPALNTKTKIKYQIDDVKLKAFPVYVQIMNNEYKPAYLSKTFQTFVPVSIICHKSLTSVYVIYLTNKVFVDSIIQKFENGDHPFIVMRDDPALNFINNENNFVNDPELPNNEQIIFDINLSQNGEEKVAETENLISLCDDNFTYTLNDPYTKSSTLNLIYQECYGLNLKQVLFDLKPKSNVKIFCKQSLHSIVWGMIVSDEMVEKQIRISTKILQSLLNYLRTTSFLEQLPTGYRKCGALINNEFYRAYVVDEIQKIVFLVDEAQLNVAEDLWLLPEFLWKDYNPSLIRPFIVTNDEIWNKFKHNEVMEVTVGHRLPAPEDHIFTIS